MRSPLRTPMVWTFVVLASVASLATAFAYLGGFLDPDGNARDMPLALVNEDQGAVLGQRVNFGRQVVAQIRAPIRQTPSTPTPAPWLAAAGFGSCRG